MVRMTRLLGVLAAMILLSGCASTVPTSTAETPTPTPTPTAACPQVEGVELPPECAPYDPDHAMTQNERYRERMEPSDEAAAAAQAAAEPLRTSLEELRVSGIITADAVEQAMADAGLAEPQLRDAAGDVLFGVAGPEGGCVFGALTAEAVTVEVGGNIMDGGCLPAQ
jgi:hypothetical protein